MKKIKLPSLVAVLTVFVAACTSATTTTGAAPSTTAAPGTTAAPTTAAPSTTAAPGTTAAANPLADYGEDPTAADPGLVEKALGPVEPSDEASWNIILASIARAHQDVGLIDMAKAIECWSQPQCDTGNDGDLVMGYADGGGNDVNVWRSVSHMEAVLQALTYPEIGRIVSTHADFSQDLADHEATISFLVQAGVDFIVGYPDAGLGLRSVLLDAKEAGIPYTSFSAGWVGLPDQEGALVPGTDYLSVVGEDLCALGTSFADILNTGIGTGKAAMLGGTPNNALSLGWQRCTQSELSDTVELVNPMTNENTTTGDTFWFAPAIPPVFSSLLTANPDINGYAYEYADGVWYGLPTYAELGIPVQNLTLALRTDEQNLFCDWAARNEPTYNIYYSAGGNFQSRVSVTAAMMNTKGAPIPGEIVVPHVMRPVTEADCNEARPDAAVSGTSLVPEDVLAAMFAG